MGGISPEISGRTFYLLTDDMDPRILHLGLECAGCGNIVAVCSYDGSGHLEPVTERMARHLVRWAREHVCGPVDDPDDPEKECEP